MIKLQLQEHLVPYKFVLGGICEETVKLEVSNLKCVEI